MQTLEIIGQQGIKHSCPQTPGNSTPGEGRAAPTPAGLSHPVRMLGQLLAGSQISFLFPRLAFNSFRNQGLNHSEIAWELRNE